MFGLVKRPSVDTNKISQAIIKTLRRHSIIAGIHRVVEGPMTVSFLVHIYQPTVANLRTISQMGPVLEKAVGWGPVRIVDRGAAIWVEFPSAQIRTPPARWAMAHSVQTSVCVGANFTGQPVSVNMVYWPSILFVGPTRKGKTEAMRSTLACILSTGQGRVCFVILSQKTTPWDKFSGRVGYLGIVSDPDRAGTVLSAIAGRMAELAAEGNRAEALVVVVDDLVHLLSTNPDIASDLAKLASTGGEVGIYLLVATQSAGMKRGTGGASVEDNMSARIVYRASSAASAARSTGYGAEGAEALSGRPGDALLILEQERERIVTPYLDEEGMAQVPLCGSRVDRSFSWYGVVQGALAESALEISKMQRPFPELPSISPPRPLSSEEADQVRRASRLMSLNALIKQVYGYKNGVTAGYIREALNDTVRSPG